MPDAKERVFEVQATFNLGNYQSLKVGRSVTIAFEPSEVVAKGKVFEDSVRESLSEGLKEDAKYYAKELFKEKVDLESSCKVKL